MPRYQIRSTAFYLQPGVCLIVTGSHTTELKSSRSINLLVTTTQTSQIRRRFLVSLIAASSATWLGSPLPAQQPTKNNRAKMLVRPHSQQPLGTRTRMVLELSGNLSVAEPDKTKKSSVRTAEVKATSTLDYEDLTVFDSTQNLPAAAARQYLEAKVETWISGHSTSQSLRSECSAVKLTRHNGSWQQYCESEPLTAREVELLHSPINSIMIDQLLPAELVQANSKWKIDEKSCQELFGLDAVHQSSLEAEIAEAEKGVATIKVSGTLDASAHGVATQLTISGNIQAQLASAGAMVTWAGLVIKEVRSISEAEPGFEITARIRIIRKEATDIEFTDAEQLQAIAKQDDPARWMLFVRSIPGRYQMLADRRWKTIIDSGDEAILRLIENNKVMAQCNITRLPKLDAGRQLTLAGLQDDIRRSLDKNFGSFEESSERVTVSGLRMARVVVVGSSSDVPVRWIYSHLSDDAGRRYSLVFTMSGADAERFAASDDQMLSTFQILPDPTPSNQPTPAPAQSAGVAITEQTTR